jgi:hypothetical protein
MSRTSDMYVEGESDGRVLPTKRPNNGGEPQAEGVGAPDTGPGQCDERFARLSTWRTVLRSGTSLTLQVVVTCWEAEGGGPFSSDGHSCVVR